MPLSTLAHISLLLSLFFLIQAEPEPEPEPLPSSPWLNNKLHDYTHHDADIEFFQNHNCSRKQHFCWKNQNDGWKRKKIMRCCKHRCVDVRSDVENCGFCGKVCPFPRRCCRGLCVDVNISRFNCGRCGNKCRFRVRCVYGMCGYG